MITKYQTDSVAALSDRMCTHSKHSSDKIR